MSIFKETFKDFVFKQLRIRESIVEQGNDPSKFKHRFGNPRSKIKIGNKTETVNIAAGAFYTNSVSKQCVIRMSSGVDVTSEEVLEASEKGMGDLLAKKYVLEGGTLSKGKPRNNFARKGGTYGDSDIRSDAKDGFGIVPMPGIIDATVETRTAYGSLRTAKVNFICHNRRQLEVLELLYMRPGMPLLLEWQWSPFINNEGKIDSDLYGVGDDWFDPSKTINEFNLSVIRNKKRSGGNYDGFVGFCKNFEMASRPDGGYDCTTEIIASGEVLEGLKSRRDGFRKKEETSDTEIDNMELILEGIKELGSIRPNPPSNHRKQPLKAIMSGPGADLAAILTGISTRTDLTLVEKNKGEEGDYDETATQEEIRTNDVNGAKRTQEFYEKYEEFFIFKNDPLSLKEVWHKHYDIPQVMGKTYMRWDIFCDLINQLVFPLPNPDKQSDPLLRMTYTQSVGGKYDPWVLAGDLADGWLLSEEYIELIPYKFPTDENVRGLKVVSNTGGRIKEVNDNHSRAVHTTVVVEDVLNNSFNPAVCLLPSQNQKKTKGIDVQKNYIGYIMFSVDYLLKTYKQMAYSDDKRKEDFNLFDYFQKIWDDANQACVGHHNFMLGTEQERPDRVRIIDLQVNPPNIEPKDLFDFKIQSNKSIVRDFNYNTTIPSGLSATIAIAAQAPTSVSDLDQVTFANFTKGIKSRFTSNTEKSTSTAEGNKTNYKEVYNSDKEKYQKNVLDLLYYLLMVSKGEGDNQEDKVDGKSFSTMSSLATSIDTAIISLSSKNPTTGKR